VSRYQRLHEIERILLEYTEGMSRAELAKRLCVHRSTIGRDIDYLSPMIPITETDHHRILIDRNAYLTTVRLTMFELEALHLAARLFARVMRFPFPHASEALRKLADAQGRVSPRLAERIRATAEDILQFASGAPAEPNQYRRHVERLGIAITENRTVTVRHFSRNRGELRSYRLIPITLEPYHEGRAIHLVGWDLDGEPPAFRTLKIERIREIQFGPSSPDVLAGVPIDSLRERMSSAWGIWTTDGAPVTVTLRFSKNVADRVAETIWHESQEVEETSDGSLIWRGTIAEPREMYPWIRGWGPDVEVIEPEWLRERHREDFEKGVMMYKSLGDADRS
jgi:predicted DNA-binding transcriptional regulator YafY